MFEDVCFFFPFLLFPKNLLPLLLYFNEIILNATTQVQYLSRRFRFRSRAISLKFRTKVHDTWFASLYGTRNVAET